MSFGGDQSPDTRRPASTADSVEEYVDRERVREVLRRRERLLDALENREEARIGAESASHRIDQVIEQKARAYVMDLAPLIRTAVADNLADEDYWRDYPHIRVEISPPPRVMWHERWMDPPEVRTPDGEVTSDPDPVVLSASGLQTVTEYRSPLSLRWERRVRHGVGSVNWGPIDYTPHLPVTFVEQVFRGTDEFLRDVGLDVNLKGGDTDVESDAF